MFQGKTKSITVTWNVDGSKLLGEHAFNTLQCSSV